MAYPVASASPPAMPGPSSRAALHAPLTSSAPGPSAGTENPRNGQSQPPRLRVGWSCKEEQPTSIVGALSSMGDPVPVRSTACLNSTRPSPMGGRLPSLSVLRVSAHPCNPGTHTETPWRSADALCWLSARRLLHGSRSEGWRDGCRAPHGAAWAPERRCGARRRGVLPGPRYWGPALSTGASHSDRARGPVARCSGCILHIPS